MGLDVKKMERQMRIFLAIAILVMPSTANAAWLTAAGRVLSVSFYPHTDTVLLKLESAGGAAGCADASVFAIDGSISADRRKQLVASLLSAQARGGIVTASYSDSGGCIGWDGAANVFRSVTRVIVE